MAPVVSKCEFVKEPGSKAVSKLPIFHQQVAFEGHKVLHDVTLSQKVVHQCRVDQARPAEEEWGISTVEIPFVNQAKETKFETKANCKWYLTQEPKINLK